MKNIYCIVVTFNGISWIGNCLKSLQQSTFKLSVVCIDNASTDGTADFIANTFSSVLLLKSFKNLGFGQANNIGLTHAINKGADYVFLLNQDAAVEPDTIEKLITIHLSNPGFGIISPIHLNGGGKEMDLYFKKYFDESFSDKTTAVDTGKAATNRESSLLISTRFVNAAAWLISIDCVKKTGGFDPIFFHYGEDNNYVQRALYKGFKVGICTNCSIFHYRETQLKTLVTPYKLLQREWTFFLTNACDPHRNNYQWFLIKRFCRHVLLLIKAAFYLELDCVKFNYRMAKNILYGWEKIAKSRAAVLADTPAIFL